MNGDESIDPLEELNQIVDDMEHTINRFSISGSVSGSIDEGYLIIPGTPEVSGEP